MKSLGTKDKMVSSAKFSARPRATEDSSYALAVRDIWQLRQGVNMHVLSRSQFLPVHVPEFVSRILQKSSEKGIVKRKL